MAFSLAQDDKLFFGAQIWRIANSVWKISTHEFGLNFVGEIELCKTLCAGIFSLDKHSLVKIKPKSMVKHLKHMFILN